MPTSRALACEFLGTAFLLATVVGSGILGHNLDSGNVAVAVLAVAFATGTVLTALILALGSISCHLNPVVTLVAALRGELKWSAVVPYILCQVAGGSAGVVVANLMFDLPAVVLSTHARTGTGQWIGEFVATFGLLGIILATSKFRPAAVPAAVGAYVAGAIWFTSSTCFANPAVTIARVLTDTLTGIRCQDVPAFVLVQLVAAGCAFLFYGWLLAGDESPAVSCRDEGASEAERVPVELAR